MKWFKENAVPFLLTALAAAVGVAVFAPYVNKLAAKVLPAAK